jgi:EAL domain-containing protein (putative c-di-GMP-specific phosphodiesterase class I)
MEHDAGESLAMERELSHALERHELSLHYQPTFDIETGAMVGAEALIRWNSATRGVVSPTRFIPLSESTGLIHAIGEFVLAEATTQTKRWLDEGLLPDGFVTWVNLSGPELSSEGIAARVVSVLEAGGLPAARLGIEVTETAIVVEGAPAERARVELQTLHDLGVHIALDDFGTGFSSLGHLRRFPIDVIKVDRSFIQGVEHNSKDAAIAANLASLAHALGLVAVAEGIESTGQLEVLRHLGCDRGQGFLLARPAPADELSRLLGQRRGAATVDGPPVAAAVPRAVTDAPRSSP